MKKIIITLAIITGALTSSVFAHDCDLVVGKELDGAMSNYTTNLKEYKIVLPDDAFNQALQNLKAYCCSQVVQGSCTQKEKDNLPKLYPESPYLFDHLVDVSMRRLDGIDKLAYNLTSDPTAKERRDYITKVANDPTGSQSSTIETTYKKYWKENTETKKNMETFIANYNKDVTTLSLEDKYDTLCGLMNAIYKKTQTKNPIIIGSAWENNSFLNGCQNIVQDRVKRENSYVKMIMIKKSNQLFDETTKAYTKKYFAEERITGLWTLIAKVQDAFKTIVQQAAVSKTCSK